jgi:hypothetical protein
MVLVYFEISSAQYLSDSDIVVHERLSSPDKRRVILKYVYDIGALGYTRMITALVAVEDTSKNLSKFTLPLEMVLILSCIPKVSILMALFSSSIVLFHQIQQKRLLPIDIETAWRRGIYTSPLLTKVMNCHNWAICT